MAAQCGQNKSDVKKRVRCKKNKECLFFSKCKQLTYKQFHCLFFHVFVCVNKVVHQSAARSHNCLEYNECGSLSWQTYYIHQSMKLPNKLECFALTITIFLNSINYFSTTKKLTIINSKITSEAYPKKCILYPRTQEK